MLTDTILCTQRQWKKRLWPLLLLFFLVHPLLAPAVFAQSWEKKMLEAGLVKVTDLAPNIRIQLMYSGTDNFMHTDVYGNFDEAYLMPHFAQKLAQAQALLEKEKGDRYCLIIYDAARPLSIQRKMWSTVKGTPSQRYVASPNNGGGRHNYGVAVDLSIYDKTLDKPVDMGSPVDHFGETAHIGKEETLVRRELITQEAQQNRHYFHNLMARVGLHPIRREWWHMQELNSIQEVRSTYTLLDF